MLRRVLACALALMMIPFSAFGQSKSAPVICLDPGHPSEIGPGARGKKMTEMRAAWLVALGLKARLEKDGYRVVLTKSTEAEKVTNKRRAEIANAAKADLFLRLHLDAAPTGGFATYYPAKAGKVGGVTGPSASVIAASKKIGPPFHEAAMKVLSGSLRNRGLLTDGQTAIGARNGGALTGSIHSRVPVLLVEMCVITDPKDEAFIASEKGRAKMVEALRAGIRAAVPLEASRK
jgi:N-acetylmuramoyl-L-alanine amidase